MTMPSPERLDLIAASMSDALSGATIRQDLPRHLKLSTVNFMSPPSVLCSHSASFVICGLASAEAVTVPLPGVALSRYSRLTLISLRVAAVVAVLLVAFVATRKAASELFLAAS